MVRSLALLASRAIIGGIFAVHGYPKLFGGPDTPVHPDAARFLGSGFRQSVAQGGVLSFTSTLERLETPSPSLLAWFVALLEFVGGICLALGALTRPVAFLLAGEMWVAIRRVHWRNGLTGQGGFEFPLALLAACLGLIASGPGDFALDAPVKRAVLPRRRWQRNRPKVGMIVVAVIGVGFLISRLSQRISRLTPATPTPQPPSPPSTEQAHELVRPLRSLAG